MLSALMLCSSSNVVSGIRKASERVPASKHRAMATMQLHLVFDRPAGFRSSSVSITMVALLSLFLFSSAVWFSTTARSALGVKACNDGVEKAYTPAVSISAVVPTTTPTKRRQIVSAAAPASCWPATVRQRDRKEGYSS